MIARLQLKDGVVIHGNQYTNAILTAIQIAFGDHDIPVVYVTAGSDGTHGVNSYHYTHRALDVRFWNVAVDLREAVAKTIRQYLPRFYDVVIESDHYHIEADAKKEATVLSSPDPR
jgi:hypothetical protein